MLIKVWVPNHFLQLNVDKTEDLVISPERSSSKIRPALDSLNQRIKPVEGNFVLNLISILKSLDGHAFFSLQGPVLKLDPW